jgi:purine-cytosine permease-like protein
LSFSTQNSLPPRSSSAEYVAGEIKKRKFLSLAASVLVAALALTFYSSDFNRFLPAKRSIRLP